MDRRAFVTGLRAMLHHDPGGEESTAPYAAGAAERVGLKAQMFEVKEAIEFERAFRSDREWHAQAVHVLPSPFFNANRRLLVNVAERYRLAALYEFREYAQDGGLMSYGVDLPVMFRRAASYVDPILKGAKPGDLPIERPTKFELVINLKTAKALGLTIPPSLPLQADQVIEWTAAPSSLASEPCSPRRSLVRRNRRGRDKDQVFLEPASPAA